MSYAQWRATADQAKELWRQAAAAQAAAQAALPFLGDDVFVHIGAFLDVRMLGRLACEISSRCISGKELQTLEEVGARLCWLVSSE